MNRLRLLALLAFVLAPTLRPPVARADLASDIDAVLEDKLLRKGHVAVQIVRLGEKAAQDEALYGHNAEMPLVPASNLKLVTTAAALEKFGDRFNFKTELRLTPE